MNALDQSFADFSLWSIAFIALLVVYEWLTGKYRDGRKTLLDWKMFALSAGVLAVLERPLLLLCCFGLMKLLLPGQQGDLHWIEEQHLTLSVVVFILIDELLHGWAHNFSHAPKPKNKMLAIFRPTTKAHIAHII